MTSPMYYVYVIFNSNRGSYYIGYTKDLEKRVKEHNTGQSGYTKHGKWELVYFEAYKSSSDARRRERMLKQRGQAKRWLLERIKDSLTFCN